MALVIDMDAPFMKCCAEVGGGKPNSMAGRCFKPAAHLLRIVMEVGSTKRTFLVPCCDKHRDGMVDAIRAIAGR